MTLSSCQSKNGQGDPRECPLTSTRDTQGSAGDPINTRTGGFDYSLVDLSLPTVSGPLLFQRTYSSLATELYTTTLGSGWTHNHDTRLIFPSDPGGEADVVWFKAHTANQYRFDITAPDTFTPYPGVLASLEGDAVNGYTLVDAAHNTYAFDGQGRLLSWNDAQGHAFTYTYSNNLLSRVSDPTGQRYLDFQYDPSDRLTTVSDNSGRYVSFDYANDNLASFTDALDQTWNYTYNDPNYSHHLSEVIDQRGETAVRTEYDASGRAVHQYDGLDQLTVDITYNPDGSSLIQDGRGYTTTHTYDYRNTLVGQVNPLGGTIDKSYTYGFRPATLTDPNGHSTALSWSMDGANLLQAVDADDNLLQMSYDSLNNLTSLIDRRGNETTFTYAGKLLTSRTDALEHSTYYTYTTASDWPQPEGLLKAVTDPLGNTTSFSYDALGQMTVMTDTLGHATRYSYDSLGRLELTTDALGRATRYEYDAAGQLLKTTGNYNESYPQNYQDVYNIVTQYAYDPLSNLVAITDTLGQATHYDYDANNRLIKVTDALSHTTGYAYDPNGNLTSKTDANGVVTAYEYDALNRLAAVIENYRPGYTPDMKTNVRTEYSYDPAGNLLAIRDARAVLEGRQDVTSFAYNELNRLVSETDPLNHAWSYAYDPEGNLITMTDTLNATTSYIYDPLGRLTAIDYPDPDADVSFEYNPLGWRTAMTDGLGITTWDFDDLGRIESITDPFSNVVGYSYDTVGNRTGMTYPDLKSVGYQYDALNRLVQVTDWSQGITQYNYDPLSRLEQEVFPNGVASYYGYDALSQVDSLKYEPPSGRLASYQYAYDPLGNRTAVTETLTQPLSDLIFSDGFESGNFLGWSGTKTTSQPDLGVITQAALLGNYGERAAPVYGRTAFAYDNSPQAEKRYRARFYFDPNDVRVGYLSSLSHTIFKAYNTDYSGGALSSPVFYLELRKYLNTYQLRSAIRNDSGGWMYSSWYNLVNGPNAIEVDWRASSGVMGNGSLALWIGGTPVSNLIWVQNSTLAVESAFLGAVDGVDSGASGWYCFDAFVSRRESYTGLEPGGIKPCGMTGLDLSATETLTGSVWITALLASKAALEISQTYALSETFFLTGTVDLPQEEWQAEALAELLEETAGNQALLAGESTTYIAYSYDPLGRLTSADHLEGTYFHYSYDAAGNRTKQTTCIGSSCKPVVTDYTYDYTKRLTSVNGVPYTWDNNGNLLSDGVNSYTYDHANRLVSITNLQYSIQNGYNGLGDRLRQTVNGNQTNYALDLNNDLAQVLSDGSNTYLYGPSTGSGWRIAQQNIVGRQYYLGDALGSVRQLTNAVGSVTLARSYEPFGKLLSTAGNPLTRYGYTGEWTDPTNLVYLRARYYDPATGRFLSKDPVRGFPNLPQTLNPYTYAINNPVRYTDPSGEFIDVALDIAFISYDIYTLINHWNTGCGDITSDLLALGLDIGGALLPFATGLGMIARVGSKTDDAIKLISKLDEVDEVVRLLPKPNRVNYPLHHIFPQRADLAARFAERGIDIEKHLMELPVEIHRRIHSSGPRGGLWNMAWQIFFEANPLASAAEIYKHAGWLIYKFGLEDVGGLIP